MKFSDIDKRLKAVNPKVIIAASVMACFLIGWVDWYAGGEFSFSIFYIVPVVAVAWYAGRKSGITISLLAALTWLATNILWR